MLQKCLLGGSEIFNQYVNSSNASIGSSGNLMTEVCETYPAAVGSAAIDNRVLGSSLIYIRKSCTRVSSLAGSVINTSPTSKPKLDPLISKVINRVS